MKQLIVRDEQSEQGALGKLYIEQVYFCETLQPDSTDKHFHIPAGKYLCKRFVGTRWKNTFEIVNLDGSSILGHKYLLFHSGNTEEDTEGCTLLGSERGKLVGNRAVLNSGNTFKKWLEITSFVKEFELEIIDNYV